MGLWLAERRSDSIQATNERTVQRYDKLARSVFLDNPSHKTVDFRALQQEIEAYSADRGMGDNLSLYFEYLPTGSSIGINDNTQLIGASLLKLPLAMSMFRASEQGRVNLNSTVSLKQDWLNDRFGKLYKKGAGHKISLRDAIKESIVNSDNTAALLLFDQISQIQGTSSPDLLGFIDANYSENSKHEVLIDSRSYGSILKCLYYACFINNDDSQELLTLLSQSTATDRLVRHIPDSVDVAHKIGTFDLSTQSDCGIFYVEKRNYVLCIMVTGSDPAASVAIADLSKIVYDYIIR